MTVSALDGVPGLGESKRKALLAQFGSVKSIKDGHASRNSPAPRGSARPWPRRSSGTSRDDDGDAATVPAINMTTGEILET